MTAELQTLTREAIADAAFSLVSLPFKHQGRDEAIGLDCAGVLVAAFRKCGVELQEEKINYRPKPDEAHVLRCLEINFALNDQGPFTQEHWPICTQRTEIETDHDYCPCPCHNDIAPTPAIGDVLHLKFKRDTAARHLGIVVELAEVLMLVHAVRRDRRVLLEPLNSVLQNADIAGIYQWPRLQS